MTNKSRQPKTQQVYPGAARYADSTANSRVGANRRVETLDVNTDVSLDTPAIAPSMTDFTVSESE